MSSLGTVGRKFMLKSYFNDFQTILPVVFVELEKKV
jgi:hypothetical protein